MKKRILFVCLGNICRSPAAEGVMKEIINANGNPAAWEIDSAGTGDWHVGELPDSRMRRAASRRGINLTHRCRQLRESDFDDFDLIIGMDENNLRNIRLMAPSKEYWAKVKGIREWLESATYVPDPYYGAERDFDHVLDLLEEACSNLYNSLI